jgi:hypothetical protein
MTREERLQKFCEMARSRVPDAYSENAGDGRYAVILRWVSSTHNEYGTHWFGTMLEPHPRGEVWAECWLVVCCYDLEEGEWL